MKFSKGRSIGLKALNSANKAGVKKFKTKAAKPKW